MTQVLSIGFTALMSGQNVPGPLQDRWSTTLQSQHDEYEKLNRARIDKKNQIANDSNLSDAGKGAGNEAADDLMVTTATALYIRRKSPLEEALAEARRAVPSIPRPDPADAAMAVRHAEIRRRLLDMGDVNAEAALVVIASSGTPEATDILSACCFDVMGPEGIINDQLKARLTKAWLSSQPRSAAAVQALSDLEVVASHFQGNCQIMRRLGNAPPLAAEDRLIDLQADD